LTPLGPRGEKPPTARRAVSGLVVHHRRPARRALIPSDIRRATSSIHGSTTAALAPPSATVPASPLAWGRRPDRPASPDPREGSAGFGPGDAREGSAGFGPGDAHEGSAGSAGVGPGDAREGSAGFGPGDARAGSAGVGPGDARDGCAAGEGERRGDGPGGRGHPGGGGQPGVCQPSTGRPGPGVLATLRRGRGSAALDRSPLTIPPMISPPAMPLTTPIAIPAIASWVSESSRPSAAIRTA
jgi:hypothetical protein